MRSFNDIISIICLLILTSGFGFSQTTWEQVKQDGGGTLIVAYSENSPFIYENDKGQLEGVEYELLSAFTDYVKERYQVDIILRWEHYDKFEILLDTLKHSKRPIIGIASLSTTAERKQEIKFSKPYMPDIEIIVSSGNIETANNLNEFSKIVKNNTAITVANSTFEKNIFDIKENYFPEINISYVPHVDLLIDSVSRGKNYWGYISLPNYLSYYKNGKNIGRQRFFMVENIGLSIATTQPSDWDMAINSFINDPEFEIIMSSLIEKYLGHTFNRVVAAISNGNADVDVKISTDKEVGVLTLERELQDLKIKQNELEIHNKNLIIYLSIIGIVLISVALGGVYRMMRLKISTNRVLSEKNKQIESQAEHLKSSYNNLKRLSNIGQEISSILSVEKINEIVYSKLNGFMEVDVFGIGIYNPEEKILEFPGVVEKGEKLNYFSYDIEDDLRLAVKCFNEKREIVIRDLKDEYIDYVRNIAPTKKGENAVSIIYMPLILGSKSIGVLTVQSFEKEAFSDHQVDIVRNIANYSKIALDNASAYEQIYKQKEILKIVNEEISEKNEFIEQQNTELIDLNKEKNDLLGIVAHDLKNPLTSAMSVTDLFKDGFLTEDQKEYLYLISKCLKRMNDLVTKILDIKLIETKKLNLNITETEIKQVVDQVVNDLKVKSQNKDIGITTHLDACTATLDKSLLVQVVDNLLSNAIKFSHPGSKVEVNLLDLQDTIRIEVKDEGPGLTREDQTRLFQKFQKLSAKPTAGEDSTGLGLSIVKKYVDIMNGKVWCESEQGDGAKFIVELEKVI